jgi:hypothetical protein
MNAPAISAEPLPKLVVTDITDPEKGIYQPFEDLSEYRTMVQNLYFPPIPEVS